jgi:hypothetical protein
MKYGTEQGHFLGQEKLTYGHNETNFGTERADFLGQEKLILGCFEINYGIMGHIDVFFWDRRS